MKIINNKISCKTQRRQVSVKDFQTPKGVREGERERERERERED